MQTFKIYTLGCKVNQYDSQVIREQLEKLSLKELDKENDASYCIINTCTVTNKADRESRYLIRLAKRQNPLSKIVVTGCYAHSNADDIKRIEGVDLVLNNNTKNTITDYLFPDSRIKKPETLGINNFKGHVRAFVKVQEGCNNFCSFCKVPYVRGRSQSRDFNLIIEEVKRLSVNGYKEIVLTGVCLGDYGKDFTEKIDLADLINEIEKIEGILRVRLSSIEANDVTKRLIDKLKVSKKLCPHLHIPFQSGDNEILKLMNKKNTKQKYLELVSKLKSSIKDISITTDIMLGFPTEDDAKFKNTLEFLKEVEPEKVHIFTFNPREGTVYSEYKNKIPQQILEERYLILKKTTQDLSIKFKNRFRNQILEILVEEKRNGYFRGYSQNYLFTGIKDDNNLTLVNRLITAKIEDIRASIMLAVKG